MAPFENKTIRKCPTAASPTMALSRPRAFLEVSLMSQWLYGRTGTVKKCPTAASPTPTPPGPRAFLEFSISLMSQWLYEGARQPLRRPPPPPGSRAFLDVSISLMSQWLYGRTGSVRKCPTAASPTPTPSRLPSVSGVFHLIDVPMALWQDWIAI
ncbi:hypothetical protein MAR_026925 [Mya arenaria]|uniref:Uncharacterized protein n=1 Tax=Mya arenaria TaxID=6604 RepID=A0ABY7ETX4_MYAAR|nr:hypothetical protein MAR_026925 [Mya arenaria]